MNSSSSASSASSTPTTINNNNNKNKNNPSSSTSTSTTFNSNHHQRNNKNQEPVAGPSTCSKFNNADDTGIEVVSIVSIAQDVRKSKNPIHLKRRAIQNSALSFSSFSSSSTASTKRNSQDAPSQNVMVMLIVGSAPSCKTLLYPKSILQQISFFCRALADQPGPDYQVVLSNLSSGAVNRVLDFCMGGEITIQRNIQKIHEIIKTANLFDIDDLKTQCLELITRELDISNVLQLRRMAIESSTNLLGAVDAFIQKHYVEIIGLESYLSFSIDEVETITTIHVQHPSAKHDIIFDAIIAWIRVDPDTRLSHASKLFKLLNLQALLDSKPGLPSTEIGPGKILRHDRACAQLFCAEQEVILIKNKSRVKDNREITSTRRRLAAAAQTGPGPSTQSQSAGVRKLIDVKSEFPALNPSSENNNQAPTPQQQQPQEEAAAATNSITPAQQPQKANKRTTPSIQTRPRLPRECHLQKRQRFDSTNYLYYTVSQQPGILTSSTSEAVAAASASSQSQTTSPAMPKLISAIDKTSAEPEPTQSTSSSSTMMPMPMLSSTVDNQSDVQEPPISQRFKILYHVASESTDAEYINLYNFATKETKQLYKLKRAHSKTVLINSSVLYAIGGSTPIFGRASKGIYGYDESHPLGVATKRTLEVAREHFAACVLNNNQIAVIGGENHHRAMVTSIEISNPISISGPPSGVSWVNAVSLKKCSMPIPRAALDACVLNGNIYAIGGIGQNHEVLNVVEMFNPDPKTRSWTTLTPMNEPRAHLKVVPFANGSKILAVGGINNNGDVLSSAEVYDPVADTWTSIVSMNFPRKDFGLVEYQNIVYAIAGGAGAATNNTNNNNEPTIEYYDSSVGKWSLMEWPKNLDTTTNARFNSCIIITQ